MLRCPSPPGTRLDPGLFDVLARDDDGGGALLYLGEAPTAAGQRVLHIVFTELIHHPEVRRCVDPDRVRAALVAEVYRVSSAEPVLLEDLARYLLEALPRPLLARVTLLRVAWSLRDAGFFALASSPHTLRPHCPAAPGWGRGLRRRWAPRPEVTVAAALAGAPRRRPSTLSAAASGGWSRPLVAGRWLLRTVSRRWLRPVPTRGGPP